MNWYIQVAAFLNALYHSVAYCPNEKTIILCSPNNLIKWHYYITRFGELNAEIVKPESKCTFIQYTFKCKYNILFLFSRYAKCHDR